MNKNLCAFVFILILLFLIILLVNRNTCSANDDNEVEDLVEGLRGGGRGGRGRGGMGRGGRGRMGRGRMGRGWWGKHGGGLRWWGGRYWPRRWGYPTYYPVVYNYGLGCEEKAIRNYRDCRNLGYNKLYCKEKFNADTLYC